MSSTAAISALYVYPVKSCGGISVASASVVRRGFQYDRRWMIVDERGHFLTQREEPTLCHVATSLEDDGLRLTMLGHGEILIPFGIDSGEELAIKVWHHEGVGLRHDAGSRWFSAAVGRCCSLVYMPDYHERAVSPSRARPGDIVSFADGYPFLIISEASLADLNSRLESPLEMRRFRPNIVVSGVPPFAEDDWPRVELGGIGFRGVKPCHRCVITTLDPETGRRGKEPLATLANFRRRENELLFGMNLIHDAEGMLSVGDAVLPL
jgi:uncharacterized protein YcbX